MNHGPLATHRFCARGEPASALGSSATQMSRNAERAGRVTGAGEGFKPGRISTDIESSAASRHEDGRRVTMGLAGLIRTAVLVGLGAIWLLA